MSAACDRIVFNITREFKQPLDVVWKAWSDADQLQHWWGPKGCKLEVLRFEFRPGGFFHYAMQFGDAPTSWGRFNYREITAPKRLVWLNSFANQYCGIARAPFSEFCPLEIHNEVNFSEESGVTKVVLQARPFGETAAESQYFDDLQPSLEQGYGGTLDQLAEFLASA